MRSQDRTRRLTPGKGWVLAALSAAVIATGAMAQMVPQLSGPDGVALTGRPAHVLYGGTRDLLVLLHIVGERPAYLEGVPTSNHDVCTFPPVETAQRR